MAMAPLSSMPPRKLRVFAFDPTVGRKYENRYIQHVTITLPWDLDPVDPEHSFVGPVGEYLEVIDYDPSSHAFYVPIDLNEDKVFLENGLTPTEDDPRFHQQMVYAVAMNTIATFEEALGRVALWAPRGPPGATKGPEEYVRQLRVYPHALRGANAYYSPEKKALLFGYFDAGERSGYIPPGTTVFTCLSQDVIAHETCHALLDGMHPRWIESTNPDVLALHEAFADIVAIFQHFSFPEVLRDQIARTRGDLEQESLLGELAQEFGQALGRGRALRDALGVRGKDKVWRLREPDRTLLETMESPHERGSILVAAVFRVFLTVYTGRVADLIRIATGGTGVLPEGAIHPDLVNRLANEAAKSARHVLQMCIRALDYCPPVDVTFGDFLRAIVTADYDLYPEDDRHYRLAVIEAFTAWGIVPRGLKVVSAQTLLWPTLREAASDQANALEELESDLLLLISRPSQVFEEMRKGARTELVESALFALWEQSLDDYAEQIAQQMNEETERKSTKKRSRRTPERHTAETILSRNLLELGLEADRQVEWLARQFYAVLFWGMITAPREGNLAQIVGLTLDNDALSAGYHSAIHSRMSVEVLSVRMANRRGRRGQMEREYVVEIIQTRRGYLDPDVQAKKDRSPTPFVVDYGDFPFRRGCTLLIDARTFEVRRVIRTTGTVADDAELDRVRAFLGGRAARPENAFDGGGGVDLDHREAFAHLHSLHGCRDRSQSFL